MTKKSIVETQTDTVIEELKQAVNDLNVTRQSVGIFEREVRRLTRLAAAGDITQKQLTEITGLPRQTIYRIIKDAE